MGGGVNPYYTLTWEIKADDVKGCNNLASPPYGNLHSSTYGDFQGFLSNSTRPFNALYHYRHNSSGRPMMLFNFGLTNAEISVSEKVQYTLYLCYAYADLSQTGANSAEWAGGTADYILGNNTTQTTYSITLPFRFAGFYESEYNPLTFYISNNPPPFEITWIFV